jgi:hypothetical protein
MHNFLSHNCYLYSKHVNLHITLLRSLKDGSYLIEIKLDITIKISWTHVMVANITITGEEKCISKPLLKHHNLTLWLTNITKTLRKLKN